MFRRAAFLRDGRYLLTVVIEREDDRGFSVCVPDLPGCSLQGESRDEALTNIREAIEPRSRP